MLLVSAYIGNLDLIPHGSFGRDPPTVYSVYSRRDKLHSDGCGMRYPLCAILQQLLNSRREHKKQKTKNREESGMNRQHATRCWDRSITVFRVSDTDEDVCLRSWRLPYLIEMEYCSLG